MVAATRGDNLGPLVPKRRNVSYLQQNQELLTTRTLSTTCRINIGATCSSYSIKLEDIARHAT